MYCAEFWAFEVLTILAGILAVEYQAANTIIFHTNTQLFQIAKGLAQATTAIVGNQIGANDVSLAIKYSKVSAVVAESIFVVTGILIYFYRLPIAQLFTDDRAVYTITASVYRVLAFNYVIDAS